MTDLCADGPLWRLASMSIRENGTGGMDESSSEIIGAIYESALTPNSWADAFDKISGALGGTAFVMSGIHQTKGLQFLVTSGQDPSFGHIIATQFATESTNPLIAAMPRLPEGELVQRRQIYSDDAYFREPLWNEVFRPQALSHTAVACVLRSDEYVVPLGILTPTNRPDFSSDQTRRLAAILPHIQRAMKISLRLAALESDVALNTEILDQLSVGLILSDGKCRPLHLNRAAQKLVSAQDGLYIKSSILVAEYHSDNATLNAAVARVAGNAGNGSETLLVHRKADRRPYVVLVAPLGPDILPFPGQPRRRALIIVSDPERLPAGLPRRLVEVFRLSPTEAQLATALLAGKRLEELAQERGISLNTIKTQMKSIFMKTDTGRQSDLVRLLSRMPDAG